MAKEIQPVQIWNNGVVTEAKYIAVICQNDNLLDQALFQYSLLSEVDYQPAEILFSGLVYMNEPAYNDYTSNDYAYNYVAETLSITIINQ